MPGSQKYRYNSYMSKQKIVYASVDLELTGFDPLVDEIVEIGIVLFEIDAGICKVVREWQSLVRPSGSLHMRIQGLTGISELDLESAPKKEAVFEQVCSLLNDVVLVGHGVSLDKRFLEVFGVPLGSVSVDTLELAQIFLPTYHSYNLENLSHALFVEHDAAHRALSDAQATVGVLRALIGVFWSLPESVRERVAALVERRGNAWISLFTGAYRERFVGTIQGAELDKGAPERLRVSIPSGGLFSTVLSVDDVRAIPWAALTNSPERWVVALPSREQVLEVAKGGYATPYLGIAEAVSARAVAEAENSAEYLSEREALALLKIMVWQAGQSRETSLLAEINWSLLGTDFKKRFSEVRPFPQVAGVVVVDYRSLAGLPVGVSVWVSEVDKYVAWLEQQSGQILSWQGIIHQFRQIYNPENGFGDLSKSPELQEAVVATDMFYASVLLLLKKHHGLVQGVVARGDLNPFVEDRITLAGRNYAQRLRRLSGLLQDKNFIRVLSGVETFFDTDAPAGELRWVEIGDGRCVFISRPLSLESTQADILRGIKRVVYTTDIQGEECLRYMARRVAMGTEITGLERQLIERPFNRPRIMAYANSVARDGAASQVVADQTACMVFPNQAVLKTYYDSQYGVSAHKQGVIAVGVHGGVNKVLRNFNFSKKSVVLVTQAALAGFSAGKFEVQLLVYVGLPTVDLAHPFIAALVQKYFRTTEEGRLIFLTLSFAKSFRMFGPASTRPESCLMIMEGEVRSSEQMLQLLCE